MRDKMKRATPPRGAVKKWLRIFGQRNGRRSGGGRAVTRPPEVATAGCEDVCLVGGAAGEQLLVPLADLVGVELEALGELSPRGIAVQRGERHLGLAGGGVIPAGTTGHGGSEAVSERSLRKPTGVQRALSELPGPLLIAQLPCGGWGI